MKPLVKIRLFSSADDAYGVGDIVIIDDKDIVAIDYGSEEEDIQPCVHFWDDGTGEHSDTDDLATMDFYDHLIVMVPEGELPFRSPQWEEPKATSQGPIINRPTDIQPIEPNYDATIQ